MTIVAIDGPSGSGKSTTAKLVSAKLNYIYIDTGAMFRGIGFALKDLGIDFSKDELTDDEMKTLTQALQELDFNYARSPEELIVINNENLSEIIREHRVSQMASDISKHTPVRDYLKQAQRDLAKANSVVMEGRDIGTVVFPDAQVKIFLSASSLERAKRRVTELRERFPDKTFDLDQIKQDIEQRDHQDSTRAVAPLMKAEDAIDVDTSHLNKEQVVEKIVDLVKGQS